MEHGFYLIISGIQFSILIGIAICIVILLIIRAISRAVNENEIREMLHNSLNEFESLRNEINEKNKNIDNYKIILGNYEMKNNLLEKELEKFKGKDFRHTITIGSIAILASEGMTHKQIAQRLDMSPTQIATRCQKYKIKTGGIWKNEVEREQQKFRNISKG